MLFTIYKIGSQNYSTGDKDLYICEYASKIFGQTSLTFLEIDDSTAIESSYTIYYTKTVIKRVVERKHIIKYKSINKNNGNISFNDYKTIYYTSKNFANIRRLNSDIFYHLLSPKFFDISNKEKLEIIESLCE